MKDAFVFRDKASSLARLEGLLAHARVLPQATIAWPRWRDEREHVLAEILALPWAIQTHAGSNAPSLIVRSCAAAEDGADVSLAGRFASVQNVVGADGLAAAVEAVFTSYGDVAADDQVLVQPMLERPTASGVVTSREVGSGRPYIVISISRGPDTATVTGGRSNDTDVFYHFRGALEQPPGREGAVVRMLRELEARTGHTRLDLEFAFVEGEEIPILLQVRPLVGSSPVAVARDRHCRQLADAEKTLQTLLGAHPLACGRRSALGCMTDWNPAEMIGVRPRPLALSLYRSLVTDTVWARQRRAYGYRDLRGFPLLIEILGAPYIDVRASFESFVPAALDDAAAARLVDCYMERLLAAPALHDKVEFEIVLSCYAFDIDDRIATLTSAGATRPDTRDLRAGLLDLTRRVLDPAASPRRADQMALERLERRRQTILRSDLAPLSAAYWLLDDCRRFGTRPFAGLARVGFIAMEMLNSLVTVGAIDEADRRAFLMSLATVASRLQQDLRTVPRPDFLARYGHLRPGAYDILAPRYDEDPDFYLPAPIIGAGDALADPDDLVDLRRMARERIARAAAPLLAEHDLGIDAWTFVDFLAQGICEREAAKFLFTRNLSDALAKLKVWGAQMRLAPSELAYGDVRAIERAYGSASNPVDVFCESIREGRTAHAITAATCLPPLITDAKAVWSFVVPTATPTFVTDRVARGPVVGDLDRTRFAGAIVLIPSADPGFDWIFAHDIAGLVTAYGGANSHMAIRAAELDLPAVIGAGERLFAAWAHAGSLRLDCGNHRVDLFPN